MAARKSATKKTKTAAKKTTAKKTVKKTTTKKTTARKAPVKKVVAKKTTVKKVSKPKAITAVKDKAYTKSQLYTVIADQTGLTKKQVSDVIDTFTQVVHAHLKKGGVGQFKLAGLVNMKVVKKPARKARKGVNPFTGEEIMIKAKPAHKVVKVAALKQLKEMAG